MAVVCKIKQLQCTAAYPANRIAKASDTRRVGNNAGDNIKIDLPNPHKSGEHNNHRCTGITSPAQSPCQHMIDAVEKKKGHIGTDEENAVFNNGRIRRKQTDGRRSKADQQGDDSNLRNDCRKIRRKI